MENSTSNASSSFASSSTSSATLDTPVLSYATKAGSSAGGQSISELDSYTERMRERRIFDKDNDEKLARDIQHNIGLPEDPLVLQVHDKIRAKNDHVLVIVGPRGEVNKVIYGVYRFIIDLNTGATICQFMPEAAAVVSDSIEPNEQGNFEFKHNYYSSGGERNTETIYWPLKNIQLYREQTGPQVVLMRYAGEDYFVSPKSFSARMPGGKVKIVDVYRKLNGPTHSSLFVGDFSPIIHYFIVIDKSTVFATKEIFKYGRLLYLNWRQMNWTDNPPTEYHWTKEAIVKIPTIWKPSISEPTPTKPVVIAQEPLDHKFAQEFLVDGYTLKYTDPMPGFPQSPYQFSQIWRNKIRISRASGGESLIAYLMNDKNEVVHMFKIRSQAFADREAKRNIRLGQGRTRFSIKRDLISMFTLPGKLLKPINADRLGKLTWSEFFPVYNVTHAGPLSAVFREGLKGQEIDLEASLVRVATYIHENGYLLVWPQYEREHFTAMVGGQVVVNTIKWNNPQKIFYALILAELLIVPTVNQLEVISAALELMEDLKKLARYMAEQIVSESRSREFGTEFSAMMDLVQDAYSKMKLQSRPNDRQGRLTGYSYSLLGGLEASQLNTFIRLSRGEVSESDSASKEPGQRTLGDFLEQ